MSIMTAEHLGRGSEIPVVDSSDIRCYVLNLPRRTDRRERINRMLSPRVSAIFTSDWSGPFDADQIDRDALESAGVRLFPWQIESDDEDWCRPMKKGEIGCTLHHLACWRDAW